jgi:hypothetical protein
LFPFAWKCQTIELAQRLAADGVHIPIIFITAHATDKGAVTEIKEWQSDYGSPSHTAREECGQLPVIPVDERANEVRAIKAG